MPSLTLQNYMILSYIPSYLTQVLKVKETTERINYFNYDGTYDSDWALYFGKLSDKVGNKRVVQIGLLGLAYDVQFQHFY